MKATALPPDHAEIHPPAGSPPAIELAGAIIGSLKIPGLMVVEGVDWRIMPGDFWVVGGPSGSGKTALLTTAAGLLRPLAGVHRLFGHVLTELPTEELLRQRLRVGLVYGEGGRLFNSLTVAQNIALPLHYHGADAAAAVQAQVQGLLDRFELSPLAETLPGRIGRGMSQRVALARALGLRPEVLLLDNPLAGLDPCQNRWWLDILARLGQGDDRLGLPPLTLVVATDNLGPWRQFAHQFALLHPKRWLCFQGWNDLAASREPALGELLETLP